MSKIEQLIKKLCPKGVERVPLGSVCTIKNGCDYKSLGTGHYPVYGSGGIMTYVDAYAYDKPSVLLPRKGSIEKRYYVEEPFWTVDTIYYTVIDDSLVLPKYLYYVVTTLNMSRFNKAGGVPSLTQGDWTRQMIPLPPRPVQDEIVKALDAMDAVVKALEEERKARFEQFEAMRDKLLKFANGGGDNVVFLRELVCKDVIKMTRGNVISKKDIAACPGDYPIYSSSAMGDGEFGRYGKYMFEEELVTWSIDGGGRFFYRPKKRFSVTNVCGYMRINNLKVLNTKYLYYVLSQQWLSKKYDYTHKALPTNIVNDYLIPMRLIADQEKIVMRLDKFEDVLRALDEEIAARREQFAGWLEKLMEFREAA